MMMENHYLNAELRRLQNVRSDFLTEDEYIAYVNSTLDTMKKYELIDDSHVIVTENRILISIQVPAKAYDILNYSFSRV